MRPRNWKTTTAGLSGALYSVLEPLLARGETPDSQTLTFALIIAVLGWLSADGTPT